MVDKLEATRDVCDFYLGDCQRCGKRADPFNQDEPCPRGPWLPATRAPANGEQVERVTKAISDALADDERACWEKIMPTAARAAIAAMNPTPTEDARSRGKVLEEAARVAEQDLDWTTFAKSRLEQWEDGPDPLRDYRLGINVGSVIAAQIRALGNKETDRHG